MIAENLILFVHDYANFNCDDRETWHSRHIGSQFPIAAIKLDEDVSLLSFSFSSSNENSEKIAVPTLRSSSSQTQLHRKMLANKEKKITSTSLDLDDGPKFKIVPTTQISFVFPKYKICVALDLSPSLFSVDSRTCRLAFEEMQHNVIENILYSLCNDFVISRNSSIRFAPEIHLSIVASTDGANKSYVLLHGFLLTSSTVEILREELKMELEALEIELFEYWSNIKLSPFEAYPLDPLIQSACKCLYRMPSDALPSIMLFTDGISNHGDVRGYNSVLTQLCRSDIALHTFRVGGDAAFCCPFGYVPDLGMLLFMSRYTNGCFFDMSDCQTSFDDMNNNENIAYGLPSVLRSMYKESVERQKESSRKQQWGNGSVSSESFTDGDDPDVFQYTFFRPSNIQVNKQRYEPMYNEEMLLSSLDVKEFVLPSDINVEWILNIRLNEGFGVTQVSKIDAGLNSYSLELQWLHNLTIIYMITPPKKSKAGERRVKEFLNNKITPTGKTVHKIKIMLVGPIELLTIFKKILNGSFLNKENKFNANEKQIVGVPEYTIQTITKLLETFKRMEEMDNLLSFISQVLIRHSISMGEATHSISLQEQQTILFKHINSLSIEEWGHWLKVVPFDVIFVVDHEQSLHSAGSRETLTNLKDSASSLSSIGGGVLTPGTAQSNIFTFSASSISRTSSSKDNFKELKEAFDNTKQISLLENLIISSGFFFVLKNPYLYVKLLTDELGREATTFAFIRVVWNSSHLATLHVGFFGTGAGMRKQVIRQLQRSIDEKHNMDRKIESSSPSRKISSYELKRSSQGIFETKDKSISQLFIPGGLYANDLVDIGNKKNGGLRKISWKWFVPNGLISGRLFNMFVDARKNESFVPIHIEKGKVVFYKEIILRQGFSSENDKYDAMYVLSKNSDPLIETINKCPVELEVPCVILYVLKDNINEDCISTEVWMEPQYGTYFNNSKRRISEGIEEKSLKQENVFHTVSNSIYEIDVKISASLFTLAGIRQKKKGSNLFEWNQLLTYSQVGDGSNNINIFDALKERKRVFYLDDAEYLVNVPFSISTVMTNSQFKSVAFLKFFPDLKNNQSIRSAGEIPTPPYEINSPPASFLSINSNEFKDPNRWLFNAFCNSLSYFSDFEIPWEDLDLSKFLFGISPISQTSPFRCFVKVLDQETIQLVVVSSYESFLKQDEGDDTPLLDEDDGSSDVSVLDSPRSYALNRLTSTSKDIILPDNITFPNHSMSSFCINIFSCSENSSASRIRNMNTAQKNREKSYATFRNEGVKGPPTKRGIRFDGGDNLDYTSRFTKKLQKVHEDNLVRCTYLSLRCGLKFNFSDFEPYLNRCNEFFIDIDISVLHEIVIKETSDGERPIHLDRRIKKICDESFAKVSSTSPLFYYSGPEFDERENDEVYKEIFTALENEIPYDSTPEGASVPLFISLEVFAESLSSVPLERVNSNMSTSSGMLPSIVYNDSITDCFLKVCKDLPPATDDLRHKVFLRVVCKALLSTNIDGKKNLNTSSTRDDDRLWENDESPRNHSLDSLPRQHQIRMRSIIRKIKALNAAEILSDLKSIYPLDSSLISMVKRQIHQLLPVSHSQKRIKLNFLFEDSGLNLFPQELLKSPFISLKAMDDVFFMVETTNLDQVRKKYSIKKEENVDYVVPYWLIISIQGPTVLVDLHHSRNSYHFNHREQIMYRLECVIKAAVHRVNQKLLLSQCHDSKIMSALLFPSANSEGYNGLPPELIDIKHINFFDESFILPSNSDGIPSIDKGRESIERLPIGSFACSLRHTIRFQLFERLGFQEGVRCIVKTLLNLRVTLESSIASSFDPINNKQLSQAVWFVYKQPDGNVFYMKLVSDELLSKKGDLLVPNDAVSRRLVRSDSFNTESSIGTAYTDKLWTPNSEGLGLCMHIYGIDQPQKAITEDLAKAIDSYLMAGSFNKLGEIIGRNVDLSLKKSDLLFIKENSAQPAFKATNNEDSSSKPKDPHPPTLSFLLKLPIEYIKDMLLFLLFLKRSFLQHFQPLITTASSLPNQNSRDNTGEESIMYDETRCHPSSFGYVDYSTNNPEYLFESASALVEGDPSKSNPVFFGNRLKYCDDLSRDEFFEFDLSDDDNNLGNSNPDVKFKPIDFSFVFNGKYNRRYTKEVSPPSINNAKFSSLTNAQETCGLGLSLVFLSIIQDGNKVKSFKSPVEAAASLRGLFPNNLETSFTLTPLFKKLGDDVTLLCGNRNPSDNRFDKGTYLQLDAWCQYQAINVDGMQSIMTECTNQALYEYAFETDLMFRSPLLHPNSNISESINSKEGWFEALVKQNSPLVFRMDISSSKVMEVLPSWSVKGFSKALSRWVELLNKSNQGFLFQNNLDGKLKQIAFDISDKDFFFTEKVFKDLKQETDDSIWLEEILSKKTNFKDNGIDVQNSFNLFTQPNESYTLINLFNSPGAENQSLITLDKFEKLTSSLSSLKESESLDSLNAFSSPIQGYGQKKISNLIFHPSLDASTLLPNHEAVSSFSMKSHAASFFKISRVSIEVLLYNWSPAIRNNFIQKDIIPAIEWVKNRNSALNNILHQKLGLFQHWPPVMGQKKDSNVYTKKSTPIKLHILREFIFYPIESPSITAESKVVLEETKVAPAVQETLPVLIKPALQDSQSTALMALNRFKKGNRGGNTPLKKPMDSQNISSPPKPDGGREKDRAANLSDLLLNKLLNGSQSRMRKIPFNNDWCADLDPLRRHSLPLLSAIHQNLSYEKILRVKKSIHELSSGVVIEELKFFTFLESSRLISSSRFPFFLSFDRNIKGLEAEIINLFYTYIRECLQKNLLVEVVTLSSKMEVSVENQIKNNLFLRAKLEESFFIIEVLFNFAESEFGCNIYYSEVESSCSLIAEEMKILTSNFSLTNISFDFHLQQLLYRAGSGFSELFHYVRTLNLLHSEFSATSLSSLDCFTYEPFHVHVSSVCRDCDLLRFIAERCEEYNLLKLSNSMDKECDALYFLSRSSDLKDHIDPLSADFLKAESKMYLCILARVESQMNKHGQINIYIVSISTNRSLDLKLDMSKFASDYMQDLLSKASRDYDRNYIWSEIMKGPASIKDALKLSNEKIDSFFTSCFIFNLSIFDSSEEMNSLLSFKIDWNSFLEFLSVYRQDLVHFIYNDDRTCLYLFIIHESDKEILISLEFSKLTSPPIFMMCRRKKNELLPRDSEIKTAPTFIENKFVKFFMKILISFLFKNM